MTYDEAVARAKRTYATNQRTHPDGMTWEVERQQRIYVVCEDREAGDYRTASFEDLETYDLGSPVVFDASEGGTEI